MRAHAISWAVAVAVVVASSNIHIHMQRSSFAGAIVGAYVGGEHVSLCAAGRESVRVVREERRRHAPSHPRRDTPLLRTSPPDSLLVGYCAAWRGPGSVEPGSKLMLSFYVR